MKTSKLLFTTFILLITSTVVMAQHKLYEKYVNNPNTESGYFTQDVIKAKAGKDENVSIQTEIIPYIKDVYKLSTTDLTTKKKLWKDIKRLVKKEKFEVLLQQKAPKDSDGDISMNSFVYMKKEGDRVKGLLMVMGLGKERLLFVHITEDAPLEIHQNLM